MRTLQLSLGGAIVLSLLGGLGGVAVAQDEEAEAMAFPTGMLVAYEYPGQAIEFNTDGTCVRHWTRTWRPQPCTYAVNGDLYTEMTFDWPSEPKVPATYYWDYDGERLSFEVWGEDMRPGRYNFYADHTFYLVEDPVAVMVALFDTAPGQRVEPIQTFVSADEATDAITDSRDVLFRVAAVDIAAGQPITPDMLEPSD